MLPVSSTVLFCPPVYDGFSSSSSLFFNLQFVAADRWAPERVKGLKEERRCKGERTSRAQTAWQHFHEKLNRIAGSMQEGSREFLCCDVE